MSILLVHYSGCKYKVFGKKQLLFLDFLLHPGVFTYPLSVNGWQSESPKNGQQE